MLPHRIVLAVFTALVSQGNIAHALPGGRYFESEHLGGQAKRDFLDTNTNLEKRTPGTAGAPGKTGPASGSGGGGGDGGDGTVCPGTVVVYKTEPTDAWDVLANIATVYMFVDLAYKGGKWVLANTVAGRKCKAATKEKWAALIQQIKTKKIKAPAVTEDQVRTAVELARSSLGIEMVPLGDPECRDLPAVQIARVSSTSTPGLTSPQLTTLLGAAGIGSPSGSVTGSASGGSDRGGSDRGGSDRGGSPPAPPSREASPGSDSSGASFRTAASQADIADLLKVIVSGATAFYADPAGIALPASASGSESGRD